jgi:predicted membrane-bound dolichyl-phosphate-mannose-protein mannosyltransferase
LVAGSIWLLGDAPLGWRVPSVVAGTASILLMYGVARRLGADPTLSLVAAALLAFDNLVFVHSRIFTLDIFQLAFMLLGAYWYLGRRPALAGMGFALAALCKIGGFFGLVALAGFELLLLFRGHEPWRSGVRAAIRRLALTGVTCGLVFLVVLGILDRVWVGYAQPLEHVQRIVSYGAALRRPDGPTGVESYPWQWLWNEMQMPYLRAERQDASGDGPAQHLYVLFMGALNPLVLALLPVGLAFAAYRWWRRGPNLKLACFAIAWFVCTYAPFYAATLLGQRVAYLFYFLPTLPAVALAGSAFLVAARVPRVVLWVYLGAVLLGFVAYFPFKTIP